jgi:GNAT superfamily N-acetyltransferase
MTGSRSTGSTDIPLTDRIALMRIREVTTDDASAVADLLGQLGYPATADSIPARLAAMAEQRIAVAWVAETAGGVVGLATVHVFAALHADAPVGDLSALVVAPGARRRGVGRALVARAEQWARGAGASRLSIAVGAQRRDAHAFYERLGFRRTGFRYAKALP